MIRFDSVWVDDLLKFRWQYLMMYDHNLNVEIVDGCNLRVDGGEPATFAAFCEKSGSQIGEFVP